ncbi:MAG TPA: hypothetical protein DHV36_07760 [Desulfobacteraceae bacterium]|nr:hypothetical protein [Desulfobacteraceae bacterium]
MRSCFSPTSWWCRTWGSPSACVKFCGFNWTRTAVSIYRFFINFTQAARMLVFSMKDLFLTRAQAMAFDKDTTF